MSYENPRIKLTDNFMDCMVKMAGGNPGAASVLVMIMKESPEIDPQGFGDGLGTILSLDTEGIYEERIWMLYKDLCGKDIVKLFACLRGSQLGFITTQQLNDAIDGTQGIFDVDDLLAEVKNRLTEFDKSATGAEAVSSAQETEKP